MATFTDDFESNDLSAWTGTADSGANVSIATTNTQAHHGSYSCLADVDATSDGMYGLAYKDVSAAATYYMRAYARFSALPAAGCKFTLMKFRNALNTAQWRITVGKDASSNAEWGLNHSGGTSETVDATINVNTWYCVEMKVVISATVGEFRLYVDGTELITWTNKNYGASNINRVYAGYQTETGFTGMVGNIYIDCLILDTSYIGVESSGIQLFTLHNEMGY